MGCYGQCVSDEEKKSDAKPQAKSKKGKLILILSISIVLVGGGTWFTLGYLKKKDVAQEEVSKEDAAKKLLPHAPKGMPVPLVRDTVVYLPKLPGKELSQDMIVSTNAKAARLEQIVVQLADTKRPRHAVARIALVSNDTDQLIEKINENQPKIFDSISKLLALKTAKEVQMPSFRSLFRADVMTVCNKLLGTNLVHEVLIPEFMMQ
jgi:flagellar basal body-associated protein FliL